MKKESKRQKVIRHLLSGVPLTKLECFRLYSYWNLGDVVYKLRVGKIDGRRHDIKTTMHKTTTNSEYAEYRLIK